MSSELATITYSHDQIELLKRTICVDSTTDEFLLFVQQCKRTGLDPFARQIHAVKRKGKMTIQVGIDGYRLIANRTGESDGQDGPYWCGTDGVWRDVWIGEKMPTAAKVTVFRKGQDRGYVGIAHMSEYYSAIGGMWDRLPVTMLAKVAESIALRKSFPQELSGIYTDDEIPEEPRQGETVNNKALPAANPQAGGQHQTPPPAASSAPSVDMGELRKQLERTGWGWKKAIRAMNHNDGTTYADDASPSEINREQLGVFLTWLTKQPDMAQAQPAADPTPATTLHTPAVQAQAEGDSW